ncbi:hypothetical protein AVEN_162904-2-1, partial [Araneus ventricosus]
PVSTTHHGSSLIFVSDDLVKASNIFLRIYRVRKSLEPPYSGPYKVPSRTAKVFTVDIEGKPTTISINKLKAEHLFPDEVAPNISLPVPACKAQKSEVVTRCRRRSRRVVNFQASPSS